jgi:hypothetical protein
VAHLTILGRSGRACPLAGATHWLSLAVRDLDEASMMGLDYLLTVLDIASASGCKVIVAGEGEAAHYTPGSDTGLALEDAIALREALLDETED